MFAERWHQLDAWPDFAAARRRRKTGSPPAKPTCCGGRLPGVVEIALAPDPACENQAAHHRLELTDREEPFGRIRRPARPLAPGRALDRLVLACELLANRHSGTSRALRRLPRWRRVSLQLLGASTTRRMSDEDRVKLITVRRVAEAVTLVVNELPQGEGRSRSRALCGDSRYRKVHGAVLTLLNQDDRCTIG
jgi:hypothetical protein